jgi:hypothetical protein
MAAGIISLLNDYLLSKAKLPLASSTAGYPANQRHQDRAKLMGSLL